VAAIAASGTKVVMTTHDLAQARRLGGEVLFLHHGRVVERAEADAFFAGPRTEEAAAFLRGADPLRQMLQLLLRHFAQQREVVCCGVELLVLFLDGLVELAQREVVAKVQKCHARLSVYFVQSDKIAHNFAVHLAGLAVARLTLVFLVLSLEVCRVPEEELGHDDANHAAKGLLARKRILHEDAVFSRGEEHEDFHFGNVVRLGLGGRRGDAAAPLWRICLRR
jgi:ABC-type proline/glycine betaine transport system ATPase subunit